MPLSTNWHVAVETRAVQHSAQSDRLTLGGATLRVSCPADEQYTAWLHHDLNGTTYETADDAWAAARSAGLIHTYQKRPYDEVLEEAARLRQNLAAARDAYRRGDEQEAKRLLSLPA